MPQTATPDFVDYAVTDIEYDPLTPIPADAPTSIGVQVPYGLPDRNLYVAASIAAEGGAFVKSFNYRCDGGAQERHEVSRALNIILDNSNKRPWEKE